MMNMGKDIKRVLVPVQFGQASEKLLCYAGQLARDFGAELLLLHTTTGRDLTFTQQSKAIQTLRCFGERVLMRCHKANDFTRFDCIVRPGTLADCIKAVVEEYQADLVLMEAGPSPTAEPARQNHAAAITQLLDCPVLVVPASASYKKLQHLVLATDFTDRDPKVLERISGFARQAGVTLTLVQVVGGNNKPQLSELKTGMRQVARQLEGQQVTLKVLEEEDMLEGVSDFAEEQQADMLLLATQDSHLMERLFSTSYIKTMAYHTQIPLLTFRQQKRKPCSGCCGNCVKKQSQTQLQEVPFAIE